MHPCDLPDGDASLATRSLVACLAAILEEEATALPCPVDGDPWPPLRDALGSRGLAVVPVRDPGSFSWGGWWVARLAGADGRPSDCHVVMAGTPSDVVWAPAGTGAPAQAAVVEGWVPTRPALELPRDPTRTAGVVEALFRSSAAAAAMEPLAAAAITPDGLAGDRYAERRGHFSPAGGSGRAVTLIEAEALDHLAREHGVALAPGAHRRNVVTRGVDLNGLIGRRVRVGEVELQVQRIAEPCSWLQRQAPPGTLRGLVHRAGVRADVLRPGTIRPGDPVEPVEG